MEKGTSHKLIRSGKRMHQTPLVKRRDALGEALKPARKASDVIAISESVSTGAEEMLRVVRELGLEGIVAKRRESIYEPGKRSGAWLKYRVNQGQEFVIGGYTPANPFHAIIVGYYEGKQLLFASKVRAGFVPHTRRTVREKMRPLETDVCPFANLPEKRCTQWALLPGRAATRRTDRVYRMDAGRASEAREL